MCSLRGQLAHRASMFFSPRSLQRRGDVVGDRQRRVVDELLVDHRDVALAHRHAGHVAPSTSTRPWSARRGPAMSRISVVLPACVGAEQHGHRARHAAPGSADTSQVSRADLLARCRSSVSSMHAPTASCICASCQCASHPARDLVALLRRVSAGRACCAATARRRRCAPIRVAAGSRSSASCRPGRDLGAHAGRRRGEQLIDAACRRRAPAAAASRSASHGWRCASACTKRSKSVSGRRAGPIQARSPPGSTARAVHAPRRRRRACAPSWSAASSASLRKVVILPPKTESSGACRRCRGRAGSRASPPTGRPTSSSSSGRTPE